MGRSGGRTRAIGLFAFGAAGGAAEANTLPSRVTGRRTELKKEKSMFIAIFGVLLVLWLLGFFAFHVAGGLIHILLVLAVISLVVHFLRGRNAA
jgi:energy-converting hydrogenase Eha subunit G